MKSPPIVVGGTAEEYWAGPRYYPTDLDLVPRPGPADIVALRELGLKKTGRHWLREDLAVAVEFPGQGDDIQRCVTVEVEGVGVRVIGCEDLYLDRIRQATASWPREGVSYDSGLEIALTNYDRMDWTYVAGRITRAEHDEKAVGITMRLVNRRLRGRARRARARVQAER